MKINKDNRLEIFEVEFDAINYDRRIKGHTDENERRLMIWAVGFALLTTHIKNLNQIEKDTIKRIKDKNQGEMTGSLTI